MHDLNLRPLEGLSVLMPVQKPSRCWKWKGTSMPLKSDSRKSRFRTRKESCRDYPSEGMVRSPNTHARQDARLDSNRLNSTRHVTDNSCWIGWTLSASIGQYHDGDGTTLRFQFGTAKTRTTSSSHLLEPMYSHGKTLLQKGREFCNEILEMISDRIPNLWSKWDASVAKRKSSIHGWTLPTRICSSAAISTNQRFSKRRSQRLYASRKRNRSYLVVLYFSICALLEQPGFKHVWIDGLGMDPWGRKCPNRSEMESMPIVSSNAVQEDERVHGRCEDQMVLSVSKQTKLERCFRLWKACEAQVGDDFHINPEEIESKYFGVLTKIFNVARFASQFDCPDEEPSAPYPIEDRWIQSEFATMMASVRTSWENLDIYTATQALKTFGTGILPHIGLKWQNLGCTMEINMLLGPFTTFYVISSLHSAQFVPSFAITFR